MKLLHSFFKELKLASRGFYFYIELFMAIILLLVLLFVVPENFNSKKKEFICYDMKLEYREYILDKIKEKDLDNSPEIVTFKLGDKKVESKFYETEDKKLYLFEDKSDLIQLTEKKRPAVGAVISLDEEGKEVYTYYLQGYESQRLQNLYKLIHIKDIDTIKDLNDSQTVEILSDITEPLSDRENVLPAFLMLNGSMMGLFIIAAYIFLDKGEGIVKAYAVTPSSLRYYLWSKIGVVLTTSVISSLILTIPIMGSRVNYGALLILLLTSGIFTSSIGLFISSFYSNITKSFGAIYMVLILLMLPSISYFMPGWEPSWIKFIPTHPLIQGFKETLITGGDIKYVLTSSLIFLIIGLGLFEVVHARFKKTLSV